MLEEYAGRGIQSFFVYVREAHPGEYYPHHDSFERKLAHAREFKRRFEVKRRILVDDLEGTVHRAFGTLPNMTYILDRAHRVVYRADWTDVESVRMAVDYLLRVAERRRRGEQLSPFYVELLSYRVNDPDVFDAALERNGPKAVAEMRAARARWARGEHIGKLPRRNADLAVE